MEQNDEKVESLWGKMDGKRFGDRVTWDKPDQRKQVKRKESALTDTDDVCYQPERKKKRSVTKEFYDEMFSIIQEELGGQPLAVVGGAIDEILILSNQNADLEIQLKKVLKPISDHVCNQLGQLISKFHEFEIGRASEDSVLFLEMEDDEEPTRTGQEQQLVSWIDDKNADNEREANVIRKIKEEAQRLKDKTGGDIDLRVGWWKTQPQMIHLETSSFDQGANNQPILSVAHVSYDPKQLVSNEKLVKITDMPYWAQPAFKGIHHLNSIQSKVYQTALFEAHNILLCAPPGTGKTNVAVLTILHQLELNRKLGGTYYHENSKIVYVAPMKSLVTQVVRCLSDCLKHLEVTVKELSGDHIISVHEFKAAQIIVTTPENWDFFTRKLGNCTYAQLVRLLILDDIHLLHHTRGPVLESIVARTLMQIKTKADIRLVGLSPILQNSPDVARFLQVDLDDGLFEFDCTCRPVQQKPVEISEKRPFQRFQLMNDICSEKVLAVMQCSRKQQVLIFVHSSKDAARTARAIRDTAMENNTIDWKSQKFIQDKIGGVASDDLKDLLPHGFALLHPGLTRDDRQIVEKLFHEKHLQVLISTRSQAWSLNLSAATVIIKGTEEYNPEKGAWMELSCMEIMRMLGVVRCQFDHGSGSGSGIIITGKEKLMYYLPLMTDQLRIQSQFISKLADQFNAEIVLGTVQNAKKACDWLSHTYLYFCMLHNPKLYGVPLGEDKTLEGRIADLIHSAATILDKDNMVKYNRSNGDFQVTELGRIASYYCITHGTIAIFKKHLKPKMGDVDIYRLLSLSEELKYVAVRQDERTTLAKLLAGEIRIPIKEALERRSAKISVLLQAYISQLQIESLSLTSDMLYIAESAGRLVGALFEIVLKQGWAQLAKKALEMSKMIRNRMWSDQTPLRQFPKPSLEAYDEESTSSGLQFKLKLTFDFPEDMVAEGFWMLVEDNDRQKILHHNHFIVDAQIGKSLVIDFLVPVPFLSKCVCRVVSDAWIGSEVERCVKV